MIIFCILAYYPYRLYQPGEISNYQGKKEFCGLLCLKRLQFCPPERQFSEIPPLYFINTNTVSLGHKGFVTKEGGLLLSHCVLKILLGSFKTQ